MIPRWSRTGRLQKHSMSLSRSTWAKGRRARAYLIPTYRARLTSPYLLKEALIRHPRLRVSVMHYGSPLIEEIIAMLGAYP